MAERLNKSINIDTLIATVGLILTVGAAVVFLYSRLSAGETKIEYISTLVNKQTSDIGAQAERLSSIEQFNRSTDKRMDEIIEQLSRINDKQDRLLEKMKKDEPGK